jgi:hypothetical protein
MFDDFGAQAFGKATTADVLVFTHPDKERPTRGDFISAKRGLRSIGAIPLGRASAPRGRPLMWTLEGLNKGDFE